MKSIRNLLAGSLLAAGALVTAAAGISIATAADATDSPPPPGPHGWHHGGEGRLLSQLNLTDDQKAQIKTIMTTAGPQMRSIHQQMHANSLKLHQLAPTDANYTGTVAEVSQANGALHSQMITQREEVRASVFKVLTPDQQTQLKALEAQMQSRGHGGWGPRGAGGPPPPPSAQ